MTAPVAETALQYGSAAGGAHHRRFLPLVLRFLSGVPAGARVLDLGCGSGWISGELIRNGYRVTGIDVSESGIRVAAAAHPAGRFLVASATDPDLSAALGGPFDAIVSVEVIEHVYSPSAFLENCRALLVDGGPLVLTTPYHGYLKNLVIALTNRFDAHVAPQAEGGHIRFWSRRTLTAQLVRHGFAPAGYAGCGRVPGLWHSMAIRAVKRA